MDENQISSKYQHIITSKRWKKLYFLYKLCDVKIIWWGLMQTIPSLVNFRLQWWSAYARSINNLISWINKQAWDEIFRVEYLKYAIQTPINRDVHRHTLQQLSCATTNMVSWNVLACNSLVKCWNPLNQHCKLNLICVWELGVYYFILVELVQSSVRRVLYVPNWLQECC